MESDYVSKLRPTTGQLFTPPQVIYKHGERHCNVIGKRIFLIRPSELSGNPTCYQIAKQEEVVK